MSRICDICKKPIPLGTSNVIELGFRGSFSDKVKKFHKVSNFDFCSFTCLGKFMPLEKEE